MFEKLINILSEFNNKRFNYYKINDYIQEIEKIMIEHNFSSIPETCYNIYHNFKDNKCSCVNCDKRAVFISFKDGYRKFCSKKCANSSITQETKDKIRKTLKTFSSKLNKEYYDIRTIKYRETLNNMSNEQRALYIKNKSEAAKLVHKNRSKEDKEKLNTKISEAVKNSEKAKEQRIKRAKLGAQALKEIKEQLTRVELIEYNKRYANHKIDIKDKEEFKKYYKLVWFYTNKNIKYVKNIHLRGKLYNLDHKFSICEGFKQGISPDIIGSYVNLEIITKKENCSKQEKCSISKEELLKLFNEISN